MLYYNKNSLENFGKGFFNLIIQNNTLFIIEYLIIVLSSDFIFINSQKDLIQISLLKLYAVLCLGYLKSISTICIN